MDNKYIIPIPHRRSELEAMRDRLRAIGAPPQHADFIDRMLSDVDAGRASCLDEDVSSACSVIDAHGEEVKLEFVP